MPRATHNPDETFRRDLETLEGGFVELRKMSYGQRTKVRELSMKASMGREAQELGFEISLAAVDEYEFANSIVDHNLEDEAGNPLNFKKAGVVSSLEPAVGAEISQLIGQLNEPATSPKVDS